ncbi:hypothetical protein BH23CHL8_BH23CHL8_30730 [soil metagenome]
MRSYWETPEGRAHQRTSRALRRGRVLVNQEPAQKGRPGNRSAGEFQSEVREQLRGFGAWPRPRAALALDVAFTTSRKQPPQIEKLAKHYLDLLGARPRKDRSVGPLFKDDRQVKLLHVTCQHAWDPDQPKAEPSIFIRSETRADALAEMSLAGEVVRRQHNDRLGWTDEDRLERDEVAEEQSLELADRWATSPNPRERQTAALLRSFVMRDRQERFLKGNDAWLTDVFIHHGHQLLNGADPRQRELAKLAARLGDEALLPALVETPRAALLHTMTSIELPPLPVEPGDYRAFRDGVAAACRDYISRRPGLQPLLVPLRVTLLVVPPAQGKDLDNILLDVLPAVNEHLRPHLEPWLLDAGAGPLEEGLADRLLDWRIKGLRRLRSLVRYSVWSAQVLELHRAPDDPEEGILAMVLGHGLNLDSIWVEAERYLDENVSP